MMTSPPKRPRILVVDDDEHLRRTLARMLAGTYEVTLAPHGAKALEILATETFDAVLTDLEMPHVGGDGLVRWLEEHQPAMAACVVVMTGGAKRAEQLAWLRAFDRDRVVAKPSSVADIVRALEAVLHRGLA